MACDAVQLLSLPNAVVAFAREAVGGHMVVVGGDKQQSGRCLNDRCPI